MMLTRRGRGRFAHLIESETRNPPQWVGQRVSFRWPITGDEGFGYLDSFPGECADGYTVATDESGTFEFEKVWAAE